MRHRKYTFKIGRTSAHRKAMMGNMLSSFFQHGKIKTTITKAKELRRRADKMITAAKVGDLHNRRKAIATMRDVDAVKVLFDEVAPRYKERHGGYTRIVRIGHRLGDSAEICYIELVEEGFKASDKSKKQSKKAPEVAKKEMTPVVDEVAKKEITPVVEEVAKKEITPVVDEVAKKEMTPVVEEVAKKEITPVVDEVAKKEITPVVDEVAKKEITPVVDEVAKKEMTPVVEEVAQTEKLIKDAE